MKIWLLLLVGIILVGASCTKTVIENVPDKSDVTIRLDWPDNSELPSGMRFCFYRQDEASGGVLQVESPVGGYEGELSLGRYRVLAYNPEVNGVNFSGMESFATATVSALTLVSGATRTDEVILIAQPSPLYSGALATELDVRKFEPVETNVAAQRLTNTLKLTFNTEKLWGVETVEGQLCGLYSSVLLSTGKATETARQQAPQVGTTFTVPVVSGSPVVSVSYFGILNPEKGEAYKNEMTLTLKGSDGWQQTTKVDMTQVLTDIAGREDESFEFELEDKIEIDVEPTQTGLCARVVSWTRLGEGEGEITYIHY